MAAALRRSRARRRRRTPVALVIVFGQLCAAEEFVSVSGVTCPIPRTEEWDKVAKWAFVDTAVEDARPPETQCWSACTQRLGSDEVLQAATSANATAGSCLCFAACPCFSKNAALGPRNGTYATAVRGDLAGISGRGQVFVLRTEDGSTLNECADDANDGPYDDAYDGAYMRENRYFLTEKSDHDVLFGARCDRGTPAAENPAAGLPAGDSSSSAPAHQGEHCVSAGTFLESEASAVTACAQHCSDMFEAPADRRPSVAAEVDFMRKTCCCLPACTCVVPDFFSITALDATVAGAVPNDACVERKAPRDEYVTYFVDGWCGVGDSLLQPARDFMTVQPPAGSNWTAASLMAACWALCAEALQDDLDAVVAAEVGNCHCFKAASDCILRTQSDGYMVIAGAVAARPLSRCSGGDGDRTSKGADSDDLRRAYDNYYLTVDAPGCTCPLAEQDVCSVTYNPDAVEGSEARYLCFANCVATFASFPGAVYGTKDECCCMHRCDCLLEETPNPHQEIGGGNCTYLSLRAFEPFPTTCTDDDDDDAAEPESSSHKKKTKRVASLFAPQSAFQTFQGAYYLVIIALVVVALLILAVFAEIAYQHRDEHAAEPPSSSSSSCDASASTSSRTTHRAPSSDAAPKVPYQPVPPADPSEEHASSGPLVAEMRQLPSDPDR